MIEHVMNFVSLCYLLASCSQYKRTIKNRKTLKDLSPFNEFFCGLGCILMVTVGVFLGAWVSVAIESWHSIYHSSTIYWILKARKKYV